MFSTRSAIILAALFLTPLLTARGTPCRETSKSPVCSKSLTITDIINMESAGSFEISPDGTWTAWVKTSPDKAKNGMTRDVFLTNLADTFTVQITGGEGNSYSPKFSPSGSFLAFVTAKEKVKPQIYVYDLRGGEPEKLTSAEQGITLFEWRNENEILFAAREDSTLRETLLREKKDDAIVVSDQQHYTQVHLFSITRKTKAAKRLTTNSGVITELSISPDGRWAVTNENQDINYTYDQRVPPKQFLLNIETNERREILTMPHVDPFNFKWDNESEGFYCIRPVSSDTTRTYVSIRRLYRYDLDKDKLREVDLGWERGLGRFYGIAKEGLVASLADGAQDRIAYVKKTKGNYKRTLISTSSGKPMMPLATKRTGLSLIYTSSNASSIPEIMTAVIKSGKLKNEKRIIGLNEPLGLKSLARSEVISWTGSRGDMVEGVLYYPLDHKEGTRYPLVVSLHGGPAGVDMNFFTENWSNYPHLLTSKGVFVLKVNYHGSGNYGLEWVESIKGHYYEYEVPDILSGIDHLVESGLVDENKLGIMGWSNGSILAIECCLESGRFKVLCAGAGDVNWISDYGNCAFGAAFDNAYLGGPPWENVETYIKKSPFFRMQMSTTPTLIIFGTDDKNVPTSQGWEHFRAMQQIGKAPVRFLLFPGATHGLRKLSHQRRKMEEELAWFEKYLFETYEEKNEALDDNSPLAMALKKAEAKRFGSLLGVSINGVLAPETVQFAGMRIGRFEVTRAQYREFDRDYTYPEGTDNYPANGISFEHASAYCEWLARQTGRPFRLPREEEMKKLLKAAKPNLEYENNMEYWAGYAATPQELEMLSEKVSEIERTRLLIEEAGSFKPVGDENVYDLGGNVAEWSTGPSGKGFAMGPSAVSTRDVRSTCSKPDTLYTGIRVLED